MSINTNPLRSYNKTQVRTLLKNIKKLRKEIETPPRPGYPYFTGLCLMLHMHCVAEPKFHDMHNSGLLPAPRWNEFPEFSGNWTFPLEPTLKDLELMHTYRLTQYKDSSSLEWLKECQAGQLTRWHLAQEAETFEERAEIMFPLCSEAYHIFDSMGRTYDECTDYGATRLDAMDWLETAAEQMLTHFKARRHA